MNERCFRPLFCTVKAELGRGQSGLMRWSWDETLPQCSIDHSTLHTAAHRATSELAAAPTFNIEWHSKSCSLGWYISLRVQQSFSFSILALKRPTFTGTRVCNEDNRTSQRHINDACNTVFPPRDFHIASAEAVIITINIVSITLRCTREKSFRLQEEPWVSHLKWIKHQIQSYTESRLIPYNCGGHLVMFQSSFTFTVNWLMCKSKIKVH